MKLELFPLGRNSIMMRIENIGDIFNINGVVSHQNIEVDSLAFGLFDLMND